MPSRRYPTLVRSVAEHVAAVGRLPLVHALTISGPPPAVDAASAVRAKDLLQRTALAPGVSFTGPVLLVDNTSRTRWTATVAAALLADAGGNLGAAARHPPAAVADRANPLPAGHPPQQTRIRAPVEERDRFQSF
jgi:hypothetical protein